MDRTYARSIMHTIVDLRRQLSSRNSTRTIINADPASASDPRLHVARDLDL